MHASEISSGLPGLMLFSRTSIGSFCYIVYVEDASCFMTANKVAKSMAIALYDHREFILQKTCAAFLKSSFLEQYLFLYLSGYLLLSLVLFTRALSPPYSFFSQPFLFSLFSLYILSLLSPIIRYSSLQIHPNYWQIACSYSLHSPYLLLTSYPPCYSSPSPSKYSL